MPSAPSGEIVQLGIIGVALLLLLFYGGTMWKIGRAHV